MTVVHVLKKQRRFLTEELTVVGARKALIEYVLDAQLETRARS